MLVTNNEMKPTRFHDFESKFTTLYSDMSRVKSVGSSKFVFKKMMVEKDFNMILQHVEQESISLSKFLVVFLGGETEYHNKSNE